MNISEAGIAFIKEWEGFGARQYDDVAGHPTIGYGHLLKPGERWPELTEAQADTLLRRDLQQFEKSVNLTVPGHLTQGQFDALVSFCFNLGQNILHGSTLLTRLQEGNQQAAADEFPRWCHAAGKVVPGLVKRRLAERAMFLGESGPPAS